MRGIRKSIVFIAMMLLVATFAGCGEEKEVAMKEFKSADESISIMFEENWATEDMGLDSWLAASSPNGRDAILVAQFAKGMYNISGIDDLKANLEDSYKMSDVKEAEKMDIPGLTGIEAYTGNMKDDNNTSGECYIVYGESDYAYYAFMYGTGKIKDKHINSFKATCASFKENAPEVENTSEVESTDTIRWFNATYAILTKANNWDYNMFGGLPANNDSMLIQQQLLSDWWEVTDRVSADETLEWLMTEGHRTDFVEDMQLLESEGIGDVAEGERVDFLCDNFGLEEEDAQAYADQYSAYEEMGENALTAWDYSRAMSLISNYYIAGYYTETEALDEALEVAGVIQDTFDSWDAFVDSYLLGYEYWSGESSDERRALYDELTAASDNPYSVDWNLTFERSW